MMRHELVRIGAGILFLAGIVVVIEVSERPRERRHAYRPQDVAERMLELAQVNSEDVLYDLECGDGGVVVLAAQKYRAHCVCIDVYSRRIADAQARARAARVEHLITFELQDWKSIDVSPATVVVLLKSGPWARWHYALRGQLTRQLRPGARIVSYAHDMGDWKPNRTTAYRKTSNETPQPVMVWIADGNVRPAQAIEVGTRKQRLPLVGFRR